MEIKVKIHRLFNNDYSNVRAAASMTLDGVLAVHGVKVMTNSKGGTWVALPSAKGKKRCEFLGAIRLPNDTFRKSAGTDISTDILFLQKRERAVDIELNPPEWIDAVTVHESEYTDNDGNKRRQLLTTNPYYQNHPEMVLGEEKIVSGPYGPQLVCKPFENADLSALLERAIQNIHAVIEEQNQVVFSTHLDHAHLHNHFVVNAVNALNGVKLQTDHAFIQRMRETNDRICRAHHLSVIDTPTGSGKSYAEWIINPICWTTLLSATHMVAHWSCTPIQISLRTLQFLICAK